ncbi:MAG: DUF2141 domain-containing protein [Pirellulaceae bacterium]|nr:DUF2141 domain-containing protein [Pirellulaceae bacterium]
MKPYRIVLVVLLCVLGFSTIQVTRIRWQLNKLQVPPKTIGKLVDNQPLDVTVAEAVGNKKRFRLRDEAPNPERETVNRSVELLIEIAGVQPGKGKIQIAIFDNPHVFPDQAKALRLAWCAADGETVDVNLSELPPGEYAIAAFQDANNDGVLNRNALGIPTEVYGFSNDARGRFGPPDYRLVVLDATADRTRLPIILR